jgi:hypothetical protein
MCKPNDKTLLPIPEFIKRDPLCVGDLSRVEAHAKDCCGEFATDAEGRLCFVVDSCLVPALLALWEKGIKTTGCCCGHGSGSGVLGLVTMYDSEGIRLCEAPPYQLVEVVERRRHENEAYQRGYEFGYAQALHELQQKSA